MLNDEQQKVLAAYINEQAEYPENVTVLPYPKHPNVVEIFGAAGGLLDGFYEVDGKIVKRQTRGSIGWEAVYEYSFD